MSDTVLENILVREYLRGLSLECISLPVAQARWSATGSIPPHSIRMLRVLWDSNICWVPRTPPQSIQDVELNVRVGTLTKTEDIRLSDAVGLSGNKGAQCQ